MNFQVDAGDFVPAVAVVIVGALTKFREADMTVLAQFDPGGYQDAVNINAGLAFKFKEHVDGAVVAGAPA